MKWDFQTLRNFESPAIRSFPVNLVIEIPVLAAPGRLKKVLARIHEQNQKIDPPCVIELRLCVNAPRFRRGANATLEQEARALDEIDRSKVYPDIKVRALFTTWSSQICEPGRAKINVTEKTDPAYRDAPYGSLRRMAHTQGLPESEQWARPSTLRMILDEDVKSFHHAVSAHRQTLQDLQSKDLGTVESPLLIEGALCAANPYRARTESEPYAPDPGAGPTASQWKILEIGWPMRGLLQGVRSLAYPSEPTLAVFPDDCPINFRDGGRNEAIDFVNQAVRSGKKVYCRRAKLYSKSERYAAEIPMHFDAASPWCLWRAFEGPLNLDNFSFARRLRAGTSLESAAAANLARSFDPAAWLKYGLNKEQMLSIAAWLNVDSTQWPEIRNVLDKLSPARLRAPPPSVQSFLDARLAPIKEGERASVAAVLGARIAGILSGSTWLACEFWPSDPNAKHKAARKREKLRALVPAQRAVQDHLRRPIAEMEWQDDQAWSRLMAHDDAGPAQRAPEGAPRAKQSEVRTWLQVPKREWSDKDEIRLESDGAQDRHRSGAASVNVDAAEELTQMDCAVDQAAPDKRAPDSEGEGEHDQRPKRAKRVPDPNRRRNPGFAAWLRKYPEVWDGKTAAQIGQNMEGLCGVAASVDQVRTAFRKASHQSKRNDAMLYHRRLHARVVGGCSDDENPDPTYHRGPLAPRITFWSPRPKSMNLQSLADIVSASTDERACGNIAETIARTLAPVRYQELQEASGSDVHAGVATVFEIAFQTVGYDAEQLNRAIGHGCNRARTHKLGGPDFLETVLRRLMIPAGDQSGTREAKSRLKDAVRLANDFDRLGDELRAKLGHLDTSCLGQCIRLCASARAPALMRPKDPMAGTSYKQQVLLHLDKLFGKTHDEMIATLTEHGVHFNAPRPKRLLSSILIDIEKAGKCVRTKKPATIQRPPASAGAADL